MDGGYFSCSVRCLKYRSTGPVEKRAYSAIVRWNERREELHEREKGKTVKEGDEIAYGDLPKHSPRRELRQRRKKTFR